MKRITIIALTLLIGVIATSSVVTAAVPQIISYQGQLTDSTGAAVADGAFLIRFQIYDDPTAGTMLWSAGVRQVEVTGGLFNYLLGDSVAFSANLFSNTSLWLGIKVGIEPEATPRTRMAASGYSLSSLRSDSVDWSGVTNVPAGFADGVDDVGGTITRVTAGTGLIGGGTTGNVTLSADTDVLQYLITGSCPPGSSIRQVNADGTVICEPDDNTNTTYTAGSGLQLSGTTFSVPTGGITTTHIGANTITTQDINSSALPAAGAVELSGSINSSTPVTLDSFEVTVPGPGYLYLNVSGQYWFDYDRGPSDQTWGAFQMGLCESANSSTSCGNTFNIYVYQDPDSTDASNHTPGFSITRVVNVGSAGTYTFFLNGETNGIIDLSFFQPPVASAIWVPSSLSVTSPARVGSEVEARPTYY